jgi:hypothetical protein
LPGIGIGTGAVVPGIGIGTIAGGGVITGPLFMTGAPIVGALVMFPPRR